MNLATETTIAATIDHILTTHHVYMRTELVYFETQIAKMCANHGKDRPEFFVIQQLLQDLRDDITAHLEKEEKILFPFATALEQSASTGAPAPHSCFASVQFPIRVMLLEHDTALDIVGKLRSVTGNYSTPPGLCQNGANFFSRLAAMEADLKEHIRLENDVLFPRVLELEASLR